MKKWLKVLMPIVVAPVATMFPIVLVTGCAKSDNEYVVDDEINKPTPVGEKEPETEDPADPEPIDEPQEEPVVDPVEPEPIVDPIVPVDPEPEIEDPVIEPEEPVVKATWSGETNEEYVRNRTISMIERDEDNNIVVGTGWILADATPEVVDDFVYYVATNMHVAMGFEEFDGVFKYGTWACREAIKNKYMDEYFQEKGIWVLDALDNVNYFDGEKIVWNNYAAFEGIDLYVQKMNLNNFQNDSKDVSIAKGLKAQFENLNNIQQQFGKINQFEAIENVNVEKFYVGGFPTHNYFEHWQFNEIDANDIAYYEAGEVVHNIGNSQLVDNAPQLIIQEPVALDWLGAGASGSMLIDELNNIIGIYWGGFGADEEGYFYPAFSVINQELIAQYI